MGTISPEARSIVRCYGPSRARALRRVFCCPEQTLFAIPGASRNGRPGSRGSRGDARAQERGACRRERGASRIPMAERTQGSLWRRDVESAARQFVLFLLAALSGSTNAGGEDFGYFSTKCGDEPPSIDRTVESVRRTGASRAAVRLRPNLRFDCRTPISRVPQRAFFRLPKRSPMRFGTAVVKMSVTSVRAPSAPRTEVAGSKPAGSNAVAQSMLFGAATASPVPRQPFHDPW
jgi:hypothetical protein